MMKVLVSLDADLASSIALRYACQMAGLVPMELQPIHVEEAGGEAGSPGTGWVRRTWETALLETGQEEITQLLNAERGSCPALLPPKLCMGSREDEILRELDSGEYDLFVEGALYSFTSANFSAKVRSRLYRHVRCPLILVRNLVPLEKVAILLSEDTDPGLVIDAFWRVLGEASLGLDVLYCRFPAHLHLGPRTPQDPEKALAMARKILDARGRQADELRVLDESPQKAGELMRDYGLVIASLPPQHRKGAMVKLLSHSPTPTMLLSPH